MQKRQRLRKGTLYCICCNLTQHIGLIDNLFRAKVNSGAPVVVSGVQSANNGNEDFVASAASCSTDTMGTFYNEQNLNSIVKCKETDENGDLRVVYLQLTVTSRLYLMRVVCLVSSLPATSATSERVFSASGLLNGPRRAHMRPNVLAMLTILRFELKWQLMLGRNHLDQFLQCVCKRLQSHDTFDE